MRATSVRIAILIILIEGVRLFGNDDPTRRRHAEKERVRRHHHDEASAGGAKRQVEEIGRTSRRSRVEIVDQRTPPQVVRNAALDFWLEMEEAEEVKPHPAKSDKLQSTALLLQIFAGQTGVAYGYMERWDLMGVSAGLLFLACSVCCLSAIRTYPKVRGGKREAIGTVTPNTNTEWCLELFLPVSCCCILYICVIGIHIWGIVVIAGNKLQDGDGHTLSEA